jgi:hypothetical protein
LEEFKMDVKCKFCGKTIKINVTEEQEKFWNSVKNDRDRPHVQHIFPNLSADERELFISGMCPTCWDKTFGPE